MGLLLASVGMALLLWMHVRSEAALKVPRPKSLALRYTGLDESKFVMKNAPEKVAVQIEGTIEQLEQYDTIKPQFLVATVDLSDAKPESSAYRVQLPRNAAIERTGVTMRLLTEEVAVIVEEVVQREMEITLDPYNAPAGLVFSSAETRPDKVTLRGPLGDLAKVDKVRARVDLSRAIGLGVRVTLEAIDRSQIPVEAVRCIPDEATVYPRLDKVAPTKNVLVSIVFASGTRPAPGFQLTDFSVSPPTVPVSGEMNLLASLKSLTTEQIRLDGLKESTTLRVRLVQPTGLRIDRSRTSVDVRLRIEPIPAVPNPAVNPPTTGGTP
jgi:YbbR domain-containing protein